MDILGSGVGAVILGWFLSCFGFDKIVINGMHELFNKNITVYGYYLMFFIAGIICCLIEHLVNKRNSNKGEEVE